MPMMISRCFSSDIASQAQLDMSIHEMTHASTIAAQRVTINEFWTHRTIFQHKAKKQATVTRHPTYYK